MNEMVKNLVIWVVIAVVLIVAVQSFKFGGMAGTSNQFGRVATGIKHDVSAPLSTTNFQTRRQLFED